MNKRSRLDEERVLVVPPTLRDGQLSQALFAGSGLSCVICRDIATLCAALQEGAGVVVLTEEALAHNRGQLLAEALATQPVWSDLPVVILASGGLKQLLGAPLIRQLGNVVMLERPVGGQTLFGVVEMALRTRRRQYQARLIAETTELLAASLDYGTTLTAITRLLVPRLADCCLLYTIDSGVPLLAATAFADDLAAERASLKQGSTALPVAQQDGHRPLAGADEPALMIGAALAEEQLRQLGVTSSLVVPLHTHGYGLGILALGTLSADGRFRADDQQSVQDLAGRVALALENARLYSLAQQARAAAEAAVAARDSLVAVVSHDLNNPLTIVLGQVQLMQRQLAKDMPSAERLLRAFGNIGRAAEQMRTQIVELLDVARLRAGQQLDLHPEPTDLVELTYTAVTAAQQTTERHQLTMRTMERPLPVLIDAVRVKRVIDNLLSNAIKYSPNGGIVSIMLTSEADSTGSWQVLEVQDEGIGVPPDDLPRIFDGFHRASNVPANIWGSGVGLASVRQIVEQHGGRVTAANAAGSGAVFRLWIPAASAE